MWAQNQKDILPETSFSIVKMFKTAISSTYEPGQFLAKI